jgi:hypothetical protein
VGRCQGTWDGCGGARVSLVQFYVEHNRITEMGPRLPLVAAHWIDLIENKGEHSAGSMDLIHGHRVRAEIMMTTPPDLAPGANQSMPPEHQLAGLVA